MDKATKYLEGSSRDHEDWGKPQWGNMRSHIRFLEQSDALKYSSRALEIGSGKGALLKHLLDCGHDAVGIDMEQWAVAESKKLYGEDFPAIVALGDDLPFDDNYFDVALSFDVLEHIPDTDAHVSEVNRVLKPGGYYLVETPNKWTNMLFEPIRFAKRYGVRNVMKFLEPPYHCSLHNYWQLTRRLEQHGFSTMYFDIPVVNEYFRAKVQAIFGRAGVFGLKLIDPDKLPLYLRTNFYVAARKQR